VVGVVSFPGVVEGVEDGVEEGVVDGVKEGVVDGVDEGVEDDDPSPGEVEGECCSVGAREVGKRVVG
jgi:hypothetical protein